MTEEAPTFLSAPPERIDVADGTVLARCRTERAADAVAAINASLDHLRPWMAWAAEPATEAGMAKFFAAAEELWDQCKDFGYSIVEGPDEAVVGGCGLHGRLGLDGLEIGYWVHVDRVGRGLATATARALTDAAFAIDGIERLRIQCEDGNASSARVPDKLGYDFEGVTVPEGGPCEGRPTQVWVVRRDHWMTSRPASAP